MLISLLEKLRFSSKEYFTGKCEKIYSYMFPTNLEKLILHAVVTAHELWKLVTKRCSIIELFRNLLSKKLKKIIPVFELTSDNDFTKQLSAILSFFGNPVKTLHPEERNGNEELYLIQALSIKSCSSLTNLSASIFLFFAMLMLDNWLGSDCKTEPFIWDYVLVTQTGIMNIVFFFSECWNLTKDRSRASYTDW